MTIFNLVVLFTLSLLCLAYICYTRQYYLYCTYSKLNSDYMVNKEVQELYEVLCEDIFRDYSEHSLLKYSLDFIYSFLINSNSNLSEQEYQSLKKFISNTNYYNMKFELKALKIVHLAFYLLVLYIFIIVLPRLLIDFMIYMFDKLLIVLFVLLIAEAVVNMYLDLNVGIFKILQKLYDLTPMNWIGELMIRLMNVF